MLLALAAARIASRPVAWVTGLGLALYAPAIFLDQLLQKSVLDLFFICLTLWLVGRLITESSRPSLWAALGATLGALSLTRENALALVVIVAIWALVKRESTKNTKKDDTKGTNRNREETRRSRQRATPPHDAPLFVAFMVSFFCWRAWLWCCFPSSRATTR